MSKYFRIVEEKKFKPNAIFNALEGKVLGGIFHGHIDKKYVSELLNKYLVHPLTKLRGDIVPGKMLGSFHFNKEIEEYFHEVNACRSAIHDLIKGDYNFIDAIMIELSLFLKENGIILRPAEYHGEKVNPYAVRTCWPSTEGDVILPHEDGAQLLDPKQKGFEIQECLEYPVLGFNICLQDQTESILSIWNTQPDQEIRKKLGVELIGYPYKFEYLNDFEKIDQPINVGDIYFFDAKNVHAVSSRSNDGGCRTTLSFFMAFIDERTVIFWT